MVWQVNFSVRRFHFLGDEIWIVFLLLQLTEFLPVVCVCICFLVKIVDSWLLDTMGKRLLRMAV